MNYEISGNPDYGDVSITLNAQEGIIAESGAMSVMSPHLRIKVRLLGGILRALIRKIFGGESFFLAHYFTDSQASLRLSPNLPGTVLCHELKGSVLLLTKGSFLACTPGIEVRTRFGGWHGLLSGEGAFLLECRGSGLLFFNAYGAVVEHKLVDQLIVDTGHVVAFEPSINYRIRGMGGLKATLFSGEGLVMDFRGSGRLYLQTRHLGGLSSWISGFLRG